MGKDIFLKKWEQFYYTHVMGLVCHFRTHLWDIKVEWSGKKVGKYRTCTRCHKAEKYESIFSGKLV